MKKIYLGADHRGFELKEKIKKYLDSEGFDYEDLGNTKYDQDDDYPDYALPVAKKVSSENAMGILICGSGQGVCFAANKIDGVRAAVGFNMEVTKQSRKDEDMNILCLASNHIGDHLALEILKTWLNTEFSDADRHIRRINKIKEIEKSN